MLVYDKKRKAPFKIDVTKELITQIQSGAEVPNLPDCFKLYPALYDQIKMNVDVMEDYVLVD